MICIPIVFSIWLLLAFDLTEFNIIFVSWPEYITIPTIQSVFLKLDPLKRIFFSSNGVCLSSVELIKFPDKKKIFKKLY